MSNVTKNLIALGLLFALLTPPLLVGGWFQLERAELRREVRATLQAGAKPGELVRLTFTEVEARQELRWERDDEFEYNGQMYDVVRTEREGGVVRYWCWPDGPETRLNQELEALTARLLHDAPEPRQQTGHLFHFLKSLYFSEGMTWQATYPAPSQSFTSYRAQEYAAPVLSIPLSPPRLG